MEEAAHATSCDQIDGGRTGSARIAFCTAMILKRFYGRRDMHFVTFNCYRHQPYLGRARARNRFVRVLQEVRVRNAFALLGYVVMPKHVHLLKWHPRDC